MIGARRSCPYIDAMDTNLSRSPLTRALATAIAGALLLGGCGSGSTGPDGGDPVAIAFTPAAQGQQLVIGQALACAVQTTPAAAVDVTWRMRGAVVGTAAEYTYDASFVRRDTLRVHAESGVSTRDWFWVIDVAAEPATTPPIVPNVQVSAGPDPVQVVVTWNRIPASTWPITHYVVKVSYAGPVTVQNWDAAQALAEIPHQAGQVGYSATFGPSDGLAPGVDAWFAIRGRDDHGQLSSLTAGGFTTITSEWWIEGRVTDDVGLPLLGVIVGTAAPVRNGNTDGAGHFRLGPYRSIDAVSVRTTTTDHFDFTSAPLSSPVDIDFDIVLPARYAIDPDCLAYGGSFLDYVRDQTRTTAVAGDTSATRLWRWDNYPVRVFLPDSTLASGRQMDDLARPMLALWNDTVGEAMFVEVATAAEADAHFRWVTDAAAGYGQVSLELPAGGVIGNVRPERMRIEVETGLLTDQFFKEVSLHELGHVLGLIEHYDNSCPTSGHLMVNGASGNLSLPEPIHPDEVRAVRLISRLRQGIDMAGYER